MRKRETGYYEDVDAGNIIVRKRPYFCLEYITKDNLIWQKVEPDSNYMREFYLGQGNNCLFPISLDEAKKRLMEWGIELVDEDAIIESKAYQQNNRKDEKNESVNE